MEDEEFTDQQQMALYFERFGDFLAGEEQSEYNGLIDPLWDAAEIVRFVLEEIPSLVEGAREQGATWTEIGKALGVSKQAAQQRFGKG